MRLDLNFINEVVDLDFLDVSYGVNMRSLDWRDAVRHSEKHLTEGRASPEETQIALMLPTDPYKVDEICRETISSATVCSMNSTKRKWMYLLLEWIYLHRGNLSDPDETLEILYSSLDYPEELDRFVYYMPHDSISNAPRDTEQRFKELRAFLDDLRLRLS